MTYLLPISGLRPRLKFSSRLTNPPFGSSTPIGTIRASSTKTAAESSTLTHTIHLPRQPGQPVTVVASAGVSGSDFRNAIESSLFKNIQTETGMLANGAMSLSQVLIQGVDMFGKHVGFLKFKADVVDKETGQKGDIVGTAVREVEEETGIHLNLDDVIDLTAFLDPSTGCKVFPSPGGCDEDISLFLYRTEVDKGIIQQLQGRQTGLRDHGEFIKVHLVSYKNLWRMTADAKALMAIALYEVAKRDGLLPPLRD